ncbi:MAG: AAA family ATPase [Eggerthellaceae bacterium]|nr:AAA family ATPase [Eggerthellaceae bacterium]
MLIKSIELENFRIFAGKNHVDFSTDSEKNVTIIMGDNGSGKTTLAQAFFWCLYGTTAFKKADDLLSFPVRDEMEVGKLKTVKVTLVLIHNGREYRISRSQEYRKDSATTLRAHSAVLSVSYKAEDGQVEFIEKENEKTNLINEIVPRSVAPYFFFDGERAEKMGNEIQDGRSKEFKTAVENLLGLSAISEALRHLKGGASTVISSYNKDYNANSDSDYQKAEREIQAAEDRIAKLEGQYAELEEQKVANLAAKEKYKAELDALKESQAWVEERKAQQAEADSCGKSKSTEEKLLVKRFGESAWSFFTEPLLERAVREIDTADVEIKEAPTGITADTIRDIIERHECICGAPVEFNSSAYETLRQWLAVVPPEHLGSAIKNFRDECALLINGDDDRNALVEDVQMRIRNIRDYERRIVDCENRIGELSGLLENAQDASSTERSYQAASRALDDVEAKMENTQRAIGQAETTLREATARRNGLSTNDATNKRVRRDKSYAEYIYASLEAEHRKRETATRVDLQKAINDVFQEFFSGSLQLELDERYNVQVKNTETGERAYDVETSEGQTVAVIFAFIAGVIRMAADAGRETDDTLVTESYPLVMDAPMSKLDNKRIEAVCEVLPAIAEQAIILIKDTDGEKAREHLDRRIGVQYACVSLEPERHSSLERVD